MSAALFARFARDIRDFQRLKTEIAECRPDVVIHMAAQSVVRRGYEDPIETYSTNVMGTVHVLEALRQLNRPCVVVNVTSDKCYANREWVWGYRENEPMGGRDPYSNSKGCAELVTALTGSPFFFQRRSIDTALPLPARAPAMPSEAATGPAISSFPTSSGRSLPAGPV